MGHLASLPATPPVPTTSRVLREALVSPRHPSVSDGAELMSPHPELHASQLENAPDWQIGLQRVGLGGSQHPHLRSGTSLGAHTLPW